MKTHVTPRKNATTFTPESVHSRTVYASLGDNKTPEHSLSLNSISSHFYARRDCMSKTGRMNRPALGFYCALPFLPVRNTCAFDQSASKSRSPSEEKVR